MQTGVHSYLWNSKGRLQAITEGSDVYSFDYDYMDRRIRESLNGTPIKQYIWSGSKICEIRDATGTVQTRYYAQGEEHNGTKYYHFKDHLGNIRELTDTSGNILAQYTYSPYGQRTKLTGTLDTNLGFTGHYHHQSGLILTHYRAYNPALGRWLSPDPLGENGGGNLYGYVLNNPINLWDPNGLIPEFPDPNPGESLANYVERVAPTPKKWIAKIANFPKHERAIQQIKGQAFYKKQLDASLVTCFTAPVMRLPRFLSPYAEVSASIYHCVSRVVDRRFVLGREEREVFVRMMRQYEAFCGVRVLSYCVTSNHFRLLVEVPPKVKGAAVEIADGEFLARLKPLYSKGYYRNVERMLGKFRADGADAAVGGVKAKFTCRMHDLSEFMKGVKQRFTQWFNSSHGRSGTLWEGRFKSVLVEDGYAARVMAAYIDLNPVRAGMVARPEDYRWSSYGEAMRPGASAGRAKARAGICRVLEQKEDPQMPGLNEVVGWNDGAAEHYRMMLFADGEEVFTEDIHAGGAPGNRKLKRVRKGFKREEVEKVLARGGKLSFGEAMRCRVRYFTDGMTVGSREFVDGVFRKSRGRFGKKRKSGARPVRSVGWQRKETGIYSMRQLVVRAIE